jgi:ADP-ribose pyrophosphatase
MDSKNPESHIVDHQELYRGKIVNLFVDTIQQSSGRKAIREVIVHPGGVAAVPVLEDGRIVLVRQYRYPLGKYILELPAGKLDSNQSPAETIGRELEEEIGYRAEDLSYECSFYSSPGICTEVIHLFIARSLLAVPQRLEEGEHITVEVHSLDECMQKIASGEIADGKSILGILWYKTKIDLK